MCVMLDHARESVPVTPTPSGSARCAKVREALMGVMNRASWDERHALAKSLGVDGPAISTAYTGAMLADALLAPRAARGEPVAWMVRSHRKRGEPMADVLYHEDPRTIKDTLWDWTKVEVIPLYAAAPLPAERGREDDVSAQETDLVAAERIAREVMDANNEYGPWENLHPAIRRDRIRTTLRGIEFGRRAALSPDAGGKP